MNEKPSFDYHLDAHERKSVEKLVPLNQAKIHIAIRADVRINGTKHKKGAVCLSEHMLVFAKKKVIGKSFSMLATLHLLDIISMSTKSDYFIEVASNTDQYTIYTQEAMRLARTIVRDYILSCALIPVSKRFKFVPHDPSKFPKFEPQLSPSQAFQFTYNAACSYFDATYQHRVVQFYHKNLMTNNGLINLNQLPLDLIETNLRSPMDLEPFFYALKYCPYIFGICCTDVIRPDLFKTIAQLIEVNNNIHIVSLENCNIDLGVEELANAIQNNPKCNVRYWDFSGNKFADAEPLMAAFFNYPTPIFFLDLGDCDLSANATTMLFEAISVNKQLWKLQYLHIPGAKITDKSAQIFKKHLQNMNDNGSYNLKSIDFGGIQSGVHHILEGLVSYPQPLENLNIADSKIKTNSLNALITFISHSAYLKELNISGTGLNVSQTTEVIKAIQHNSDICKNFSLHIGGLKLHGKDLTDILNVLKKTPSAWILLDLADSGLEKDDVDTLTKMVPKLPNLASLQLNDNFHHSQTGIGDCLSKLVQIAQLKSVGLKGCKSNGLESELTPVLRALRTNDHILSLDIRNNYGGAEQCNQLAKVVQSNNTLIQLLYDGARPKTVEPILDLLDSMKNSKSLVSVMLPADDTYKALAKLPSKDRARFIPSIASKQDAVYLNALTNQAMKGMMSFMQIKHVPELNDIVEELTGQLAEDLTKVELHLHSAVGSLIGLKLPFASENEVTGDEAHITVVAHGADEYETPEAAQQVVEKVGEDLTNLATLQFNSLAIKRPSLGSRTLRSPANKDYSSEDYYSSDEDYYNSDNDYDSDSDHPRERKRKSVNINADVSQMPQNY
ncbi:hypothetical protein TVAG_227780 [Trichomonas vaginalis G3]|uniref:Leucine Rich Repeat family protein n=1 Tax=Trichomonas vaginalis (strain ATCC PRA-98 / G3) TaxID=412133 RepID=A2ERT0_TRIV3|nr:barbed-end actin filament uncapping [Trichomonas vaginalis G3]EAY04661.1 hypothetical protein TVAG_227780 [Trichomonas vaginalis G3]KAI5549434.1 barbed-end actin filament uncapping [Trichomonas vaginalis G3]|eukprot:XP_001316884.1 hypothetical protein [Trichomonas vaginalis G3]